MGTYEAIIPTKHVSKTDKDELQKAHDEEAYFEALSLKGGAVKKVTPISQGYRISYQKK